MHCHVGWLAAWLLSCQTLGLKCSHLLAWLAARLTGQVCLSQAVPCAKHLEHLMFVMLEASKCSSHFDPANFERARPTTFGPSPRHDVFPLSCVLLSFAIRRVQQFCHPGPAARPIASFGNGQLRRQRPKAGAKPPPRRQKQGQERRPRLPVLVSQSRRRRRQLQGQ